MGAIDSKNGVINTKFEGTEKRTVQGERVKKGMSGGQKGGSSGVKKGAAEQ